MRDVMFTGGAPQRATRNSYGYDLAVKDDTLVKGHTSAILTTGLCLAHQLPIGSEEGVAMLILPRSSTALRYGLIVANSPGLIDADYAGEIGIVVYNTRNDQIITAGTRLAQAVFVKVFLPTTHQLKLQDAELTRGGFGSTGT